MRGKRHYPRLLLLRPNQTGPPLVQTIVTRSFGLSMYSQIHIENSHAAIFSMVSRNTNSTINYIVMSLYVYTN